MGLGIAAGWQDPIPPVLQLKLPGTLVACPPEAGLGDGAAGCSSNHTDTVAIGTSVTHLVARLYPVGGRETASQRVYSE